MIRPVNELNTVGLLFERPTVPIQERRQQSASLSDFFALPQFSSGIFECDRKSILAAIRLRLFD